MISLRRTLISLVDLPPSKRKNALGTVGQILLVNDLKADVLERSAARSDGAHLRDPVSDLDTVRDVLVVRVGGVPLVRHAPLVDSELRGSSLAPARKGEGSKTHESSGLENLADLVVAALPVGSMASRLDRCARPSALFPPPPVCQQRTVNRIKAVLAKLLGERHEVALDERDLLLQPGLLRVLGRPRHLERIVVQADDIGVGEPRDLTRRAADSAPDVEDAHLGLDARLGGEEVLCCHCIRACGGRGRRDGPWRAMAW